jgi:hypothetical protein
MIDENKMKTKRPQVQKFVSVTTMILATVSWSPCARAGDLNVIVDSLEAANIRFPRRVVTTMRSGAVESSQTMERLTEGDGHFIHRSSNVSLEFYLRNSVAYIRGPAGWDRYEFPAPSALQESFGWFRTGIANTIRDVQNLGPQVIDGVTITRYSLKVRYRDQAGLYDGTVEIWITDDVDRLPLRSTFVGTHAEQPTVVEMHATYGNAASFEFPVGVGGP